jgi:hypothetical protein
MCKSLAFVGRSRCILSCSAHIGLKVTHKYLYKFYFYLSLFSVCCVQNMILIRDKPMSHRTRVHGFA